MRDTDHVVEIGGVEFIHSSDTVNFGGVPLINDLGTAVDNGIDSEDVMPLHDDSKLTKKAEAFRSRTATKEINQSTEVKDAASEQEPKRDLEDAFGEETIIPPVVHKVSQEFRYY